MSDKFKIRNLENEKRRLIKQICKVEKAIHDIKTKEVILTGDLVLETKITDCKICGQERPDIEKKTIFDIEIVREGDYTICNLIAKNNKFLYKNEVFTGVAKCCKEDEYEKGIGVAIAKIRAIKEVNEFDIKYLSED